MVFGILSFVWASVGTDGSMFLPLIVAALAGVHLFVPKGGVTALGLWAAYLLGGIVAGIMLMGFAIADPPSDEYVRVAMPMTVLYAASVLAMIAKVR